MLLSDSFSIVRLRLIASFDSGHQPLLPQGRQQPPPHVHGQRKREPVLRVLFRPLPQHPPPPQHQQQQAHPPACGRMPELEPDGVPRPGRLIQVESRGGGRRGGVRKQQQQRQGSSSNSSSGLKSSSSSSSNRVRRGRGGRPLAAAGAQRLCSPLSHRTYPPRPWG